MAFVVVAVLPLAAFYFFQQRQLEREVFAYAESRLEQLAVVQQRRIEHELERLTGQLGLVATRTQMRLILAAYAERGDATGLPLLEQILEDALAPAQNLLGMRIEAPDGAVLAAAWKRDPVVAGAGSAAGEPVLGLVAGDEQDTPRIALVAGAHGQLLAELSTGLQLGERSLGTLHLVSDTRDIGAILSDYADPLQGGRTLLLGTTRDGRHVLLTPGTSRGAGLEVAELASVRVLEATMHAESPEAHRRLLASDDENLYAFRPVADLPLQVVTLASRDALRQVGLGRARTLGVNIAILLLLAVAASLLMAARIARPVRELSKATRRLRHGESHVRVPEKGWGEIGELARAFNLTAAELERHARELEDETRRSREAQRELTDMASTDHLTGLMNRRRFLEVLAAQLDSPSPPGRQGALLYLDLDRFKPINDAYGHDAGDETLRVVARRLQGLLRAGDPVARLGGDEFAVLIRKTLPREELQGLVERITEALSRPMSIQGRRVQVGCSIGIAEIDAASTQQELLHRADRDMYRVKSARRAQEKRGR
jgi:diguanylate cyclase (GGDEF)-like protein